MNGIVILLQESFFLDIDVLQNHGIVSITHEKFINLSTGCGIKNNPLEKLNFSKNYKTYFAVLFIV